jgi:hypothetical protein
MFENPGFPGFSRFKSVETKAVQLFAATSIIRQHPGLVASPESCGIMAD